MCVRTRPRNAWKGFMASSLESPESGRMKLQRVDRTHYRVRYLLMSSDRPAALDGIGSNVDGRAAESSR